MTECPFLSTYDNVVECFKECALYNYKENGGVCPFKSLNDYSTTEKYDDFIGDSEKSSISFIKSAYCKKDQEY